VKQGGLGTNRFVPVLEKNRKFAMPVKQNQPLAITVSNIQKIFSMGQNLIAWNEYIFSISELSIIFFHKWA